jgi:hypothetical protein
MPRIEIVCKSLVQDGFWGRWLEQRECAQIRGEWRMICTSVGLRFTLDVLYDRCQLRSVWQMNSFHFIANFPEHRICPSERKLRGSKSETYDSKET